MLGVAIFWGIATTSYRDEHIQVDFLWEWAGPRGKRRIDLFATIVLFAVPGGVLVDAAVQGR